MTRFWSTSQRKQRVISMNEILKVMRFDFLNAKPVAMGAYWVIAGMCFLLSLFLSPAICGGIIFGALLLVIPLQNIEAKSDISKLYGILPVNRKNIARARFLYIFSVSFLTELIEIVLGLTAYSLKLYRLMPDKDTALMKFVSNAFSDLFMAFIVIVGAFAAICLIFSYMEMMGQIFGRENEMKSIVITIGVLAAIGLTFVILSSKDILPVLRLPSLPESTSGRILLGVIINAVMFGLCVLFGEITANQLAKREL